MKRMALHVALNHDESIPRDQLADLIFDAIGKAVQDKGLEARIDTRSLEVRFISRGQMASYTRGYENSTRV